MRHDLRRLRESCALSMAEVAERTDTSVGTIWALEVGRTKMPYPKTIRRLAECYGVTPDEVRAAMKVSE